MENMGKKKQKNKVLYVITKSNWGGAQRYVFDLVTNLPDTFEPVVALGGNGPLKIRLEESGIRTIPLPFLTRDVKLFSDLFVLKNLVSLFKKEAPDIIHLNSSKIGGLGSLAGRLAGVPHIIFTAHGWAFREERPPLQKLAIKFLSWLTILWSHAVITVSERDAREAAAMLFAKEKIVLIHNGIPAARIEERSAARRLVGHETQGPELWVGTIGELHKNKGHAYAIESLATIRDKYPFTFFIIGEGEERKTLERLISDRGLESRVILLGNRTDAATILPAFNVFLFPSVKEGLPYTILEAGLAGLPVIASAVGGIPEIITDMESGILVRPKSTEEITKAFDYLLSHKKESLNFGKKLRAKIKKDFSLKRMLAETIAMYHIASLKEKSVEETPDAL